MKSLLFLIIFPLLAFADNKTLTPPGVEKGEIPNFMVYLDWLLSALFFAVGISAVLMIIIGGVGYVLTSAQGKPNDVKDAENRIKYAIGGLLLALASWLILNTINPDLLKKGLTLPPAGQFTNPGNPTNPTGQVSSCGDYSQTDCASKSNGGCEWKNGVCAPAQTDLQLHWEEWPCVGNFQQFNDTACPAKTNPEKQNFCCGKKR